MYVEQIVLKLQWTHTAHMWGRKNILLGTSKLKIWAAVIKCPRLGEESA